MRKQTHFRGRLVNYSKTYPRVYWPEHPVAQASGLAAVHRIVAYDLWSDDVFGMDVHHKNEDALDWDEGNLELLEPSEHSRHHKGAVKVTRDCSYCDEPVVVEKSRRARREHVYCDNYCRGKGLEKIEWPSDDALLKSLEEMSYSALGRELGVSGNAIRNRLRRSGRLN